MVQILIRLEDAESKEIKQIATGLGLSTSAFVRKIVKEHLRKAKQKEQSDNSLKHIRALVPILAQALGRTQNLLIKEAPEEQAKILTVTQKDMEELSESLLQIYDQKVQ